MLWLISISEWVSEWLGNKKLKSKKTHRKLLFFISIWKFRIMLRHAYCKKNIEAEFMLIVCLGKTKSWIWFQKLLFQNTLLSQCSAFFFILFFNENIVYNGKHCIGVRTILLITQFLVKIEDHLDFISHWIT